MSDSLSELELQRLADGELSDQQQQRLLCRLDASPEGWRTVALAFLEQQVVGEASREMISAANPPPPPVTARSAPNGHFVRWPAVTAAVVFGIGLGVWGNAFWGSNRSQPERVVVENDNGLDETASQAGDDPDTEFAGRPIPVMSLEFARSDSDGGVWSIPVYDPSDVTDRYWEFEDVIPADVRSAFSRQGYHVEHNREFYSVPLDDGRRVAVPVDTVQIRYAGL